MSDSAHGTCPVCGLSNQTVHYDVRDDKHRVKCARCGNFLITDSALAVFADKELSPLFSAWLRDKTESGTEIPEIDSGSAQQVLSQLPEYSPSEKQYLFLRAIARKTDYPGQQIPLDLNIDFPLAWAAKQEELQYYLRALQARGLLELPAELSASRAIVSPSGWEFLDEYERPSLFSDQAFIAMEFSDEKKEIWTAGIEPAVTKAGYKPLRIDLVPHTQRIDAKIISEIRQSRFLVADVTGQNPGVYFEAGYALGLGLPVIWSARDDEIEKLHFDTRQYNHILWESFEGLQSDLYYRITALLGKGPYDESAN